MMKEVDVLIIGGSAAGLVSAVTVKSNNPDKNVLMIRKEDNVMIPCGIPYIFGSLDNSEKNILPDTSLEKLGIELMIDTVSSFDKQSKICVTENGEKITYDKLILATGSKPYFPTWLKGADLKNVFTIPKDKIYLDKLMESLRQCKNVAVVGAGFIGVEVSDEISKMGKKVSLIEIQPYILGQAFDETVAKEAEEILTSRNVAVYTGTGVKEIQGEETVNKIVLDDESELEVDAVILAMGYHPNVALAKAAGIELTENGAINVDSYMRTRSKDIFAVGDCAAKRDFATGKISGVMLASTACSEARVAGMNLYSLSTIRSFQGTIGIYSTNIGDTSFGVAGLTERFAKNEGFDIVTGSFSGMDRHPGHLNNGHKQTVKLIVSKESGIILGGEIVGGDSVGELINVIGFIIQSGMSLTDLLVSQIGTQPMLTASPAGYPLIKAAESAARQMA